MDVSGKGVVLRSSIHLHANTEHRLQSVHLFGLATMEEETATLTGMEEMVLMVHDHQ